jgi:hypothetical protein
MKGYVLNAFLYIYQENTAQASKDKALIAQNQNVTRFYYV